MLRFSLRTLAGVVTGIGIACAALINAVPWIASLSWTVVVIVLSLATVAAVLCTSASRGFWAGFAIVGWLYALVTVSPLLGNLQGSLFSTMLLQRAASEMPQAQAQSPEFATEVATSYVPAPRYYSQAPATASVLPPATAVLTPLPPQPNPVPSPPATFAYGMPVYSTTTIRLQNTQFMASFVSVGQALLVLILALCGGMLGRLIVVRNNRLAQAADHSA